MRTGSPVRRLTVVKKPRPQRVATRAAHPPTSARLTGGPARQARAGWEEQFARMAAHGDDALLYDASLANIWDEQEWVW